MATGIAQRDMARVASGKSTSSFLYLALLTLASVVLYAIVIALLASPIALIVYSAQTQGWLGLALGVFFTIFLSYSLLARRRRLRGIAVTRDQYPQLAAALDEVCQQARVQTPRRILLVPGAQFFVTQRHPLRRCFLPETVVGVGGLALLNDHEVSALLLRAMTSQIQSDTALGNFFSGADTAVQRILNSVRWALRGQYYSSIGFASRYMDNGDIETMRFVAYHRMGTGRGNIGVGWGAEFVVVIINGILWLILLPVRFVWFLFHLLHLRFSWGAEFAADRVAVQAYGTFAFVNAVAGVGAAGNTLHDALLDLRQDMAKHDNPNFSAELRRYYSELPHQYLVQLRLKAVRDYRTLDGAFPSISDSLRLAATLNAPTPPLAAAPRPAYELLTPAGASDPSRAEIEMTTSLFGSASKRRR